MGSVIPQRVLFLLSKTARIQGIHKIEYFIPEPYCMWVNKNKGISFAPLRGRERLDCCRLKCSSCMLSNLRVTVWGINENVSMECYKYDLLTLHIDTLINIGGLWKVFEGARYWFAICVDEILCKKFKDTDKQRRNKRGKGWTDFARICYHCPFVLATAFVHIIIFKSKN